MFTDTKRIRKALKDRLWIALGVKMHRRLKIVDTLATAEAAIAPRLYFEFKRMASSVNGQPLSRDQIGCDFDLVLAASGDDEDEADYLAYSLAQVLQTFDDIYWDTATKERIDHGRLAWRFNVTLLADIEPDPEPTPQSEPSPEEE